MCFFDIVLLFKNIFVEWLRLNNICWLEDCCMGFFGIFLSSGVFFVVGLVILNIIFGGLDTVFCFLLIKFIKSRC